MIDEKFSPEGFEKCGYSTKESRKLANALADKIARQMRKVTKLVSYEVLCLKNSFI